MAVADSLAGPVRGGGRHVAQDHLLDRSFLCRSRRLRRRKRDAHSTPKLKLLAQACGNSEQVVKKNSAIYSIVFEPPP